MKEVLQALAPLNEHVSDNRDRFRKALTERKFFFEQERDIRWSPILLSGETKKIDKAIEEKLKELDLIYKSRKFMEEIEDKPVEYQLNVSELSDGFQVDLSVIKKAINGQENSIKAISYFVWKAF